MRCDPSLNPDQMNTDAEKFPCDGRIQFQHFFYEPKDEDDGKQLTCSLDEDGDMYPDYVADPVNLRVTPREDEFNSLSNVEYGNDDYEDEKEELQVELVEPWGKTRLRLSKLDFLIHCFLRRFFRLSLIYSLSRINSFFSRRKN